MATKRFASLAADEIEKWKMLINAKETMKGNQKATRTLKAYLKEARQDENFEEFDVVKLNEVLRHFYMNARKQDSDHYKATSFKNIRHALNRHLQGVPYNRKMDIIKETTFSDANVCFKAALAELKRIGKGSVVHHPVINEPDRKKLYESISMSLDAPEAILNKVQFDIRLYLCRTSQENMYGMTKSTFEVLNDPKTELKYASKC
jgi:endo-1,4-beta-D-glucanase Y